MSTIEAVIMWAALFGAVFALNLRGWASPKTEAEQRRLLPGMEPWTKERRRRFNTGVVIRALLFAVLFTFAAWAIASRLQELT